MSRLTYGTLLANVTVGLSDQSNLILPDLKQYLLQELTALQQRILVELIEYWQHASIYAL